MQTIHKIIAKNLSLHIFPIMTITPPYLLFLQICCININYIENSAALQEPKTKKTPESISTPRLHPLSRVLGYPLQILPFLPHMLANQLIQLSGDYLVHGFVGWNGCNSPVTFILP